MLIEGDPVRARAIADAHPGADVRPVTALVGFGHDDSLGAILSSAPAPTEFDLLAVDIDGCDHHVWEATRRHRRKVVAR